jgi:hypothetical protein
MCAEMQAGWEIAMRVLMGIGSVLGILALPLLAGEPLVPGVNVGERVPLLWEYRATGPRAGQTGALLCTYASQPIVVVYTREITAPVIRLIKKTDAAIERHRVHASATYRDNLGSYVVFICDSNQREKREAELKAIAEKEKIQNVVLSLIVDDGLQKKLGNDAETTVLLAYRAFTKTSHAFRKGELNDQHIDRLLADLPKIMPEKK